MDRFKQPDFEPETPKQRVSEQATLYLQRIIAEDMNDERLRKAAEKAAISGDHRDLHEYLELRKKLLY